MKKLFFIIMITLIGLNILLGQVKVEKYDVLRLEKDMLYFYPAEIEKASTFSFNKLFGFWEIDEVKLKESDAILRFDFITTSDTTNAYQIYQFIVEIDDTILLVPVEDWSKWLDQITKKEELIRVGPFFFTNSYNEAGHMYFFDFPKGYKLKENSHSGNLFNLKLDDTWVKIYFGPSFTTNNDMLVKQKWVSGIDIGYDEIPKKFWLKKLSKYDWIIYH